MLTVDSRRVRLCANYVTNDKIAHSSYRAACRRILFQSDCAHGGYLH